MIVINIISIVSNTVYSSSSSKTVPLSLIRTDKPSHIILDRTAKIDVNANSSVDTNAITKLSIFFFIPVRELI